MKWVPERYPASLPSSPAGNLANDPGSLYQTGEQAVNRALQKMDVGYIGMMLLHHPGTNDVKAYKAMEKYIEAGKTTLDIQLHRSSLYATA